MKYVFIDDILYRRSFDDALLRCLTHDEINTTLEQAQGSLEIILWSNKFTHKEECAGLSILESTILEKDTEQGWNQKMVG